MPDLIPCPSCQATLRVPAGAEAIRCPQCKHVVNLTTQAPAALPMAIPLPPAGLPKAVPLPFDQPDPPPPPAVLPMAKAMAADKPVVRGRVVREDEPQAKSKSRSNRDIDRPDYGTLESECNYARIALRLFSIGCGFGALSVIFFSLFLGAVSVASQSYTLPFTITIVLMAVQALLFMGAFGTAIGGPKVMRPAAAVGLVVTLMHIGATLGVSISAMDLCKVFDLESSSNNERIHALFFITAGISNLSGFTDIPWMFLMGIFDNAYNPWQVVLVAIGACLEFWRLSLLCTLVQYYAAEGKSIELGFESLRFVYRIIWVVITGVVLKLIILVVIMLTGGEPTFARVFRIPMAALTQAYYMWWIFTWLKQMTTCKEIIEVVDPQRYASKATNLDVY